MSLTEIIKLIIEKKNSALFYTPPVYEGAVSYIFGKPSETVETNLYENLTAQMNRIVRLRSDYEIGYGYIAYESGYQFEESLHDLRKERDENLIKFNFFNNGSFRIIASSEIDHSDVSGYLGSRRFNCSNLEFNTGKKEYIENINLVKKYIKRGDTYQVNYTLNSNFNFTGDETAFILNLIFNQSGKYIAVINDDRKIIISSSPELFFQISKNEILCRPMKGTIKRGKNVREDKNFYEELMNSEKDKAENIMIVDLLRNDVGRIAEIDTVSAAGKYRIEKYESVYQMTSEITGRLAKTHFPDIIENLFPCGSVTGAPKISTMKIINEIEKSERNIYTGTIGLLKKDEMIFNVPIRTIEIDVHNKQGVIGLGSGVVWESDPEEEYNEVKLKGEFLTNPAPYFELFESMLVENGSVFLLDYHLKRLNDSANYFLFDHNEEKFLLILNKIIDKCDKEKKYKVRILLNKWGGYNYSVDEINETISEIDVCISNITVSSLNKFLYFKTTNRDTYESEFRVNRGNGYGETIFLNEHGNVTEGSRTNIFIVKDDKLITPPIEDGLLSGCYRDYLLEKNAGAVQKSFKVDDLLSADNVSIVNSVRKEVSVKRIFRNGSLLKEY
jgi:para-aminobenzoate synthetase/4-amino-4-deoxychorismate lyase